MSSLDEMWPPVTYTEGIPDRKHSGYIQYTYRGFYILAACESTDKQHISPEDPEESRFNKEMWAH